MCVPSVISFLKSHGKCQSFFISESTPYFANQERHFTGELSSEETSGTTCLRVVGNELWSCESDGVTVFSFDLNTIRHIRRHEFGSVFSAAQLDEESVAVATLGGLYIISNLG